MPNVTIPPEHIPSPRPAQPLRVLFVCDSTSPVGGAELLTRTLSSGLTNRGHDVRILSSSISDDDGAAFADYTCFGTRSRWQALLRTANPSALRVLKRAIEEFRPDVIHVRMFLTQISPIVMPLFRRVPTVYHIDYFGSVCPTGLKMLRDGSPCTTRAGMACLHNRCLSHLQFVPLMVQHRLFHHWSDVFAAVVPVSRRVKQVLADHGVESGEVISNCVPEPRAMASMSDTPTVAVAARLVYEKGVDVVVRAMANVSRTVPTARLIIAGDGPERQPLQRLAEDMRLSERITFLGHVPHRQLDETLAPAWVQVAPSRWVEPFGLVAAEALMRGTPAIVSNSGGLAEIIDDGETGFLVPPNSVASMTEALLKLLTNRPLAQRMGAAGREVALRRFSADVCLDQFVDLYARVIASRAAAAPPQNAPPPKAWTRAPEEPA